MSEFKYLGIRLAVDIDECLAHFIPALCEFHNEIHGSSLSSSSFSSYEFHNVWGGTREEADAKMISFFQSVHFKEKIRPIDGAFEALKWLKAQFPGVELHIVTARQHFLEDETRSWIAKHYPGIFEELHFGNHYSTSGKKRSKPEMCREIGAIALIDDSQVYAGQCAVEGIKTVLFGNYAWNIHADGAGGVLWNLRNKRFAGNIIRVGDDWGKAAETLIQIIRESQLPKIAAIQICSTDNKEENIHILNRLIRQAAIQGALFISLPEACLQIGAKGDLWGEESPESESLTYLRALAKELGIWLNIGGVAMQREKERCTNTAYLISNTGAIVASYDKVHLFDNPLTNMYESKYTVPGDPTQIVTFDMELHGQVFRIGLTICYDMRFPEVYGRLAEAGCDLVVIPSAFMVKTGRAHWETLLRARAIETQMYVVAAAQCGLHEGIEGGRSSYNHGMTVTTSPSLNDFMKALREGEVVTVIP